MSNLALKYRPTRFSDVVGQVFLKRVLKSVIKKGEPYPNGFLFSGPRGIGKTTLARIFSAAVNCENPDDGEPCGSCDSCVSIREGKASSVVEIDAASHGLVDDVRKLTEIACYTHSGKCRVIIFDEAHSASDKAFNAFLKILEEPPSSVVFILATTEPDKILKTVKSRLMPFDFRRITNADITKRLKFICEKEGIASNDGALDEISQISEGGLRDSIVMLEQLVLFDGEVKLETVEEMFGVGRGRDYYNFLMSVKSGDYIKGIGVINKYFDCVGEGTLFIKGFISYFSDLLFHKLGVSRSVDENIDNMFTIDSIGDSVNILWDVYKMSKDAYRMAAVILYIRFKRLLNPSESMEEDVVDIDSYLESCKGN